MINGNELRVGNWVETYVVMMSGSWYDKVGKGHGQDVITEPTIRQKRVDIKDLDIIFTPPLGLATYRPIPITEELLIKCGFEEKVVKGFYYLEIGNDTLLVSGGEDVWVEKIVKDEDYSVSLGGASNIHQLQNLYFALCNKELDVELGTSGSNNR